MHNRFTKGKNRITSISKLARVSRQARKLFSGSAFASATWGHQASGISDSNLIALERDALACTGIIPQGRCRTVALAISYGILGTPKARIIRETIRAWVDVSRFSTNIIDDIRVAWSVAVSNITKSAKPRDLVKGIMSNLICILLAAGWHPSVYNCWRDDAGDVWTLTDFSVSPDIVASAVIKAVCARDLVRASTHYNGKGIQHGIDYHNTMACTRSLKDSQYPLKCAMESILAAATWPEDRIHSIHASVSPICKRCGEPLCDALHVFWTCPANANIEDEEVTSTQNLISSAVSSSEEYPCMWLRGILPEKFTTIEPFYNPTHLLKIEYVNKTNSPIRWGSGSYYRDASGGIF